MLCALILYVSSGNYSLKSMPNDKLLIILSTLKIYLKNLLRRSWRRNIFQILFWCLEFEPWPTYCLLHYSDFKYTSCSFYVGLSSVFIWYFFAAKQLIDKKNIISLYRFLEPMHSLLYWLIRWGVLPTESGILSLWLLVNASK